MLLFRKCKIVNNKNDTVSGKCKNEKGGQKDDKF